MGVAAVRPLKFLGLLFFLSSLSLAQTSPRVLIKKPVDESQLTVLKGNTHPVARAEFDQGAAPLDLLMNRMLLVLKRSDEQETALRTLIDDQQDKASPNYHKWLTTDEFGKQFGPSDHDIQQVTSTPAASVWCSWPPAAAWRSCLLWPRFRLRMMDSRSSVVVRCRSVTI